MNNYEEVCEYVDGLKVLAKPFNTYFEENRFSRETTADDIYARLQEEGAFYIPFENDVEAMKFLIKNDVSLEKSYKLYVETYSWHFNFNSKNAASFLRAEMNEERFRKRLRNLKAFLKRLPW